ncbi:UNVERIFIED_CONTAM: gcy-28 [Trichonephila clavipes]
MEEKSIHMFLVDSEEKLTNPKTLNAEISLFEATKNRTKNLDLLFEALKTIKPSSVASERVFSISGITGNVSINEKGDRFVDYSLLDMDPETGIYEVVANYYGVSQQFVDIPGKHIHWAGNRGGPPADVPMCGFDGSLCSDELFPQYVIVTSVLSSVVLKN